MCCGATISDYFQVNIEDGCLLQHFYGSGILLDTLLDVTNFGLHLIVRNSPHYLF